MFETPDDRPHKVNRCFMRVVITGPGINGVSEVCNERQGFKVRVMVIRVRTRVKG